MTKAAIYIRASTKAQDDKDSPQQQLDLCEHLADKKDYEVFKVYKDVKSGTKKREGFFEMIADANYFDVVIAYSQDRLYRGTLDTGYQEFARLVDKDIFGVELVTENFDKNYMELFASIGGIETRTRAKRIKRGVIAKLNRGEHWLIHLKYGYSQDENRNATVNLIESEWVKQIHAWYLEGLGVRKICDKLIAEGAPQRHLKPATWIPAYIYKLLNFETYSTGIQKTTRDGEMFEAVVPQILETDTYKRVQAVLAKNRHRFRAHNIINDYLLTGLVACPDGSGWNSGTPKKRDNKKEFDHSQAYYRCNKMSTYRKKNTHPNCPSSILVRKLDVFVWDKVFGILENPKLLTRAKNKRIAEIKELNKDAQAKTRKLKEALKGIEVQRKSYSEYFGRSSANGGNFTEDDLDIQLSRLTEEKQEALKQLAEIELVSSPDIGKIDKIIDSHLDDIKAAGEWLNREPKNEAEAKQQFKERKEIVQALVERVYLEKDQEPKIELSLNLGEILSLPELELGLW